MNVLLPALYRPGMPQALRDRFAEQIARLPGEVAVDERSWEPDHPGENYWGRFARMRQAMVDEHLDSHDYVLWIDTDITFDPDLLHRLLETSRNAIVSPLILIEGRQQQYDTAGTRPDFEHRSSSGVPEPGVHDMFSVGGCVLVPAWVHHGVRFAAQSDEDQSANTEWTSLCVGAAMQGCRVLWNTEVVVHHANLPDYGEGWH